MRPVEHKGRKFDVAGVPIECRDRKVRYFSAIYPIRADGKLENRPISIHEPSLSASHGALVLHDAEIQAEDYAENYVKQDFLEQELG